MYSFARPNLNLSRWRLAIALIVCLLVASCGSSTRSTSTHAPTTDPTTTTTSAPATASPGLTAQERDTLNKDVDAFNTAANRGDDTGAALAATTEAADVTGMADAHRGTPLEGQLRELADDLTAASDALTHHDQTALNQAEAKVQQLTSALGS